MAADDGVVAGSCCSEGIDWPTAAELDPGAADSASAFKLFLWETSTQPALFCRSELPVGS